MIIWMASWPRCGSTLFRLVLHGYTGLPTYSYANDPILNKAPIQQAIHQKRLPAPFLSMGPYHEKPQYYFIKVHLYQGHVVRVVKDAPAVLIVRDMRDAVVSLANYTTWRHGSRKFAQELPRIIANANWQPFVEGWMKVTDVVVRYEDLLTSPRDELVKVLEGLKLPIKVKDKAQFPTFEEMQRSLPDFFRKGQVGSWRDVLTDKQEAQLWKSCGETMERLGYAR